MKASKIFSKTQKTDPSGEISTNAKLLMKAGFIDKLGAGIYTYLPLSLRVIRKIEKIIRSELNRIDAEELLMPALNPKSNWEKTGRWNVPEMYKIADEEYGLGWTHEEIITPLAKKFLNSEKDFPKSLYQVQTKYRNEPRAKSGILRGREFIMNDMYSFHLTEEDLDTYYEKVKEAYLKIYERCGLKDYTYFTLADGGAFTKGFSHEFQTLTEAGEDVIYICKKCKLALNKEVEHKKCPSCGEEDFEERKAIEVGNIFKLGTKYSEAFDFKINDKNVIMGCYGIGVSRLLGTIVEVFNDEKGIIFPKEVAPYDIYLVDIKGGEKSEQLYKALEYKGYDVIFDDRDKTPGEKFSDADLIGIPIRIIISEKTLKEDSVEVKKRGEEKSVLVKIKEITKYLEKC
ncbi:MAG: His/Gly/Thr/Pro-type tRNA ligase C-terminal domain-containing protein [Candidatus Pacebacteria bacterium]|nr:His/Gly/Thr/Pro-type tRNA ligase C-terminal domain-containing protein [Candidatus Paceibacterota bacterium]